MSDSCSRCGQPIWADESVRRGYGLDCARAHGLPYGPYDEIPGPAHPRGHDPRERWRTDARRVLTVQPPDGFDTAAALRRYLAT